MKPDPWDMIKNPELVNGYLVSVSLVKKRNEKKRIISRELKQVGEDKVWGAQR